MVFVILNYGFYFLILWSLVFEADFLVGVTFLCTQECVYGTSQEIRSTGREVIACLRNCNTAAEKRITFETWKGYVNNTGRTKKLAINVNTYRSATYFEEQSSFWKPESLLAGKWNFSPFITVCTTAHPSLVLIVDQINPVHTHTLFISVRYMLCV
jgi:hypothetical protein